MPRDLRAETEELEPLSKQQAHLASPQVPEMQEPAGLLMEHPVRGAVLSEKHIPQCLALETQAFSNPDHRCTEEKFRYRLSKSGQVCHGIFISAEPGTTAAEVATAASAEPVVSNVDRKDVLVAHAISTLTTNPTVLDEDMAIVTDEDLRSDPSKANLGHKAHGTTVALHSLAVLPEYQSKGYGGMLLRDYIQRMSQQGVYDRIAIITFEDLVPFYEKFDFKNLGPSKVQFGGGGWIDMVRELEPFEAQE